MAQRSCRSGSSTASSTVAGQRRRARVGAGCQPAGECGQRPAPPDVVVADDVDVDRPDSRVTVPLVPGPVERGRPRAAPGRAEDDLRRVDAARELQDCARDVVPDDRVVSAAERLDEQSLRREAGDPGLGQPVAARDVHRKQVPPVERAAMRAARRIRVSPSGPPVSATTTRSRVSQVRGDAVLLAVALHALLDGVGQPEQGQLAQRGEVAGPEVVAERGVDLLGRIDVAVRHPPPQRLRRHVHSSTCSAARTTESGRVSRCGTPVISSTTSLQRFEVLDVERADHVDAGLEQRLDVLPPLLVRAGSGHVRVRQLVDQGEMWPVRQHRVEVHLLELGTAIDDLLARGDGQVVDALGGVRAAVGLDERDEDVRAAISTAAALIEHCVRLADARRGAQVDPQRPACH